MNEVAETTGNSEGNVSNDRVLQIGPEMSAGEPESLSESTDLDTLMAAILGSDAGDRVPLERVAQPRMLEPKKSEPELEPPWQVELAMVLAEQRRREVADAGRPPTLVPVLAVPVTTEGEVNALRPAWMTSRVLLLTVGALAAMLVTLSALGRQNANDDRVPVAAERLTPATATAAPETAAPGPSILPTAVSAAASASPAAAANGTPTSSIPALSSSGDGSASSARAPASSIASSSRNTPKRIAPAPTAASRPVTLKPSSQAPPSPTRRAESEPVSEAARAAEPAVGTAVAEIPPSPTIDTTGTIESATLLRGATSPDATVSDPDPGTPASEVVAASGAKPPAPASPVALRRVPPRLLRSARPAYPTHLSAAGIGGTVTVALRVDAQGRVLDVRSVSGIPQLRSLAEAAVHRWRYEPATVNGTPVESDLQVSFNFDPTTKRQP